LQAFVTVFILSVNLSTYPLALIRAPVRSAVGP